MRRRALGAAAVLALGFAGCGGDDKPATAATAEAGLVWKGAPTVFSPKELPADKILTGTIRNAAGKPVELRVDQVDVKDAAGKSLGANVRFVGNFGHGLYGPGGPPAPLKASRYDQARLGERLTLPPNEERAMTVAWRVPEGGANAARVVVSGFALTLP